MNTQMICKSSEKYANMMKAARDAGKAVTTIEGALAVLTKFWNKGFDKAAKELGYGKPSDFGKAFREGANGAFNSVMFGTNAKGVLCLGVWKSVKVQDMAEEKAVLDANGRVTHPYKYDAAGNVVMADVWKEVKRWTPALLFEVMAQSQYADMQTAIEEVATADGVEIPAENVEYLAARAVEKVRKANATGKEVVPAVPAATSKKAAATSKKTASTGKKDAATGKKAASTGKKTVSTSKKTVSTSKRAA